MMIPPKKSKAAREKTEEEEPPRNGETQASDDEAPQLLPHKKPKPSVNIFTEPLVEGKRARTVNAVDALLKEWITEHLEAKEGMRLQKDEVYESYLDTCANKAINGVEQGRFLRAIEDEFPQGYVVKESSAYKKKITEKKQVQRKKNPVKGETLKLKMREIINGALQDLGNPKNGIRFFNLKQYIAAHFPALQIDLRPDTLLNALNRGVYYGHVILVKGVGKAGFYRLPGDPSNEEEEDKAKDKGKKETKEKKEGEEGEEKEEKGEKKEGNEDEKEGEEEKEKEPEGKKSRKAAVPAKSKDKAKKKKKHAPKAIYRKFIIHSEPERVQDCFPLAFTYMAEPKESSVSKIKKYLRRYYQVKNIDEKLVKILADGVEKGWWSHVSGSKPAGVYRLELEEYDASADDDLPGKIMNALVACTEPKACSARVLKDYITQYHPELKVAERPYVFKRSLLKCVADGSIRQLSGLGISGTFQWAHIFIPSPTILQGADDENDYDSDGNELVEEASEDEEESLPDVTPYFDAYVPRPTKRGHARKSAAGVDLYMDGTSVSTAANRPLPTAAKKPSKSQPAKSPKAKKGKGHKPKEVKREREPAKAQPSRKGRGKPTVEVDSDSDADDEEEVKPKSTKKSKKPGKGAKKPKVDSESEDEEDAEESKPPKSHKKSAKGSPKKASPKSKKGKGKSKGRRG